MDPELNQDGEALPELPDIHPDIQQEEKQQIKKKLPLVCLILYGAAAVSGILYIIFLNSVPVADFFNRYVSPIVRGVLAKLTGWIPFSLAECLLLLLPIIIIAVVSYGIKHYSGSWRNIGVFCAILLSLGAYVFTTFTLGFVPAYRGSKLDARLGIEKNEVSAEELYYTAELLASKVNEEINAVKFRADGSSIMPYGYAEMNDKLMEAYKKACEKYEFIQDIDTNIKPIMLSEPMTYTHISGVYTFFTGEANFNTNFPDYTLPYTVAHEFAHQRGIAREDEANFVAFLVCSESDDAYIRYCAYLNLYEYVASALYSANPTYYAQLYTELPLDMRLEMVAYSKFFDKYRESIASEVSDTVNDTFLTINGTEGTKSYGMVVDLAVAYFKK
jgi:hypothetical protein